MCDQASFAFAPGVLRLTVEYAKGLKECRFFRQAPYCDIRVGAQSQCTRTAACAEGPVWNQTFHFTLATENEAELEVKEAHLLWEDSLGHAVFNLNQVRAAGHDHLLLPLLSRKTGSQQGTAVSLALAWCPNYDASTTAGSGRDCDCSNHSSAISSRRSSRHASEHGGGSANGDGSISGSGGGDGAEVTTAPRHKLSAPPEPSPPQPLPDPVGPCTTPATATATRLPTPPLMPPTPPRDIRQPATQSPGASPSPSPCPSPCPSSGLVYTPYTVLSLSPLSPSASCSPRSGCRRAMPPPHLSASPCRAGCDEPYPGPQVIVQWHHHHHPCGMAGRQSHRGARQPEQAVIREEEL